MSKVLAVINFIDKHGRPVDPGFGVDEGGSIDNSLPGEGGNVDNSLPSRPGPVDPGFGVGFPLPPVIDNGFPVSPGHPSTGPVFPTYPVDPGYGLPSRPTVWPKPPVGIWPPPHPVYPSLPIYPTDGIDNSPPGQPEKPGGTPGTPGHLPALPPGSVWPPLPPIIQGKILAFAWLVGIGYRWVVIDPSLKPGFPLPGEKPGHPDNTLPGSQPGVDNSLPGSGGRPDNSLPPAAQPKR